MLTKLGQYGHLGYQEEFFGLGSVAVPIEQQGNASRLDWGDIGLVHHYVPWIRDDGRYVPADVYEDSYREVSGIPLVLPQSFNSLEHQVWHLHQDLVIALGLLREGDLWVCPNEGYSEVARLVRDDEGKPVLLEIKSNFLLDYLCARRMGFQISYYVNRVLIVDSLGGLNLPEGGAQAVTPGKRWEFRVTRISEGGMPYASETAVFHVARTDSEATDDVPELAFPTETNTTSSSWRIRHDAGKCLFVLQGELWADEWIAPGPTSPRVRGDDEIDSPNFFTDAAGTRESGANLLRDGRWLWFRPEVVNALIECRGGALSWFTHDTGSVACSPDDDVVFGTNDIGLVNVYAKDIGQLPGWQQQIWAGFCVVPDGGVSEELIQTQVRANPANTVAPEVSFKQYHQAVDRAFLSLTGTSLFRDHEAIPSLLNGIHRFRALSTSGLLDLAKDVARITADAINTPPLQSIVAPPTGEKWGSLKSLERVLSRRSSPEKARAAMGPLVGVYQLRNADAHLPSSSLEEAFGLLEIRADQRPIDQGIQVIKSCAQALARIAHILDE